MAAAGNWRHATYALVMVQASSFNQKLLQRWFGWIELNFLNLEWNRVEKKNEWQLITQELVLVLVNPASQLVVRSFSSLS